MSIGSRTVLVIGVLAFTLAVGCGKKNEPAAKTSETTSGAAVPAPPPLPPGMSTHLKRNPGAPFYNFDSLGPINFPAVQKSNQISAEAAVGITGWAADPSKQFLAGGVDVVIDGIPYSARYGTDRTDVAKHYDKPEFAKSGFQLLLAPRQLTKGAHGVAIRVITHDQKSYNEGPLVPFMVN